jgi:hypothetical protein
MRIIVFFILTLIPACSQIQSKLNADIQAVTLPDLQAALASATASNDADGAACWSDMIDYVNALPTATTPNAIPQIKGIASALEASRNAANAQPIAIPPIPPKLHRDCAVVILDARELALKLGLTGAAALHGLRP